MGTRHDNPHFPGTPEHLLWERYQAAYDSQPISSRLLDLEMHLREIGGALQHMSEEVAPPHIQARLRHDLSVLVEAVKELEDAAEQVAHVEQNRRSSKD